MITHSAYERSRPALQILSRQSSRSSLAEWSRFCDTHRFAAESMGIASLHPSYVLTFSSATFAQPQEHPTQQDANNCSPQPDCKINYPALRPGATTRSQLVGGQNSITNNLDGLINGIAPPPPANIGSVNGRRVCVPWC